MEQGSPPRPASPESALGGAASSAHWHQLCNAALQEFEQAVVSFQQALPPRAQNPASEGSGASPAPADPLIDPLPAGAGGPRRGVAELAAWLAELTRELVALSSRLEGGLAALDSKRAASEQHARGLQQQMEVMSGQLQQVLQQSVDFAADRGLRQQVEVMPSQLQQVLQQNTGLTADRGLQQQVEAMSGQLQQVEGGLAALDSKRAASEQNARGLQQQVEVMSGQLQQVFEQSKDLAADRGLQQQVEVMSDQLQQVFQQNAGLTADLEGGLAALDSKRVAFEQNARGLQQQVEVMSGQLQQVLQQNVGLATQLDGLDGRLCSAQQWEDDFSSKLLSLSQAQMQGKSDLHRLSREVDLMRKLGEEVRGKVLDDMSGLDRKLRADLWTLEADRQAAAAWEEVGSSFDPAAGEASTRRFGGQGYGPKG